MLVWYMTFYCAEYIFAGTLWNVCPFLQNILSHHYCHIITCGSHKIWLKNGWHFHDFPEQWLCSHDSLPRSADDLTSMFTLIVFQGEASLHLSWVSLRIVDKRLSVIFLLLSSTGLLSFHGACALSGACTQWCVYTWWCMYTRSPSGWV